LRAIAHNPDVEARVEGKISRHKNIQSTMTQGQLPVSGLLQKVFAEVQIGPTGLRYPLNPIQKIG